MAADIIMPKLSLTMSEGTVVNWFKGVGDNVTKGEDLLEVTTDKTNAVVECPETGILHQILKDVDDTVEVFEKLGIIALPGEALDVDIIKHDVEFYDNSTSKTEASDTTIQKTNKIEVPNTTMSVAASPAARRVARENGISQQELLSIPPTGPGGRITHRDVEEYISQNKIRITPLAKKIAHENSVDLENIKVEKRQLITKADLQAIISREDKTNTANMVPLSGIRKVIAEKMSLSSHTTAPVTLTTEVDATKMDVLYKELKKAAIEKFNQRISFTDLLSLAVIKSLKIHSMINSNLMESNIVNNQEVNLGIAVAVENGLLVPVISSASQMTLLEISAKRQELVEKARKGCLSGDEMSGGTFTITNLGMYDIDAFTPIINIPEVAMLGVGRVVEKASVIDGKIEIRKMMYLSLTFDHRVIDGAPAAKFLKDLKDLLENPSELIL